MSTFIKTKKITGQYGTSDISVEVTPNYKSVTKNVHQPVTHDEVPRTIWQHSIKGYINNSLKFDEISETGEDACIKRAEAIFANLKETAGLLVNRPPSKNFIQTLKELGYEDGADSNSTGQVPT